MATEAAQNAKNLQQGLKELLNTRLPWDRDVELQRKSLRQQYLRLLFNYPYAPESDDVDNHLWNMTCYQFISRYKERLNALDRAAYGSPRQQHPQPQQGQPPPVVEHRNLLKRFKQFLAEEEKFWVHLIVRIRHVFALDEAQRALTVLEINDETPPPNADSAAPRRNLLQFPSSADSVSPPPTPEHRHSKIALLSKALVCLGDIRRYKELYNESGGRPRAGHEDGRLATRPRRSRGGAPILPRMRDYDKATKCYEQARLLQPSDGNAANQLAILASYQRDNFTSLVHYYRALCVRNRYEPAVENVNSRLSKALESWKHKGPQGTRMKEQDTTLPRIRVELFQEEVIVLHALWRLPISEKDFKTSDNSQRVLDDFKALVSERILPDTMIARVLTLIQGALWIHRSARHPTNGASSRRSGSSTNNAIESHIATHLLALHCILLEVGIAEIAEAPPEDADLAQCITATFRRTLPALRLAGKWVRANLKYILQSRSSPESAGDQSESSEEERNRRRTRPRRGRRASHLVSIKGLDEFWDMYVHFSNALSRKFPLERLPLLSTPLEEDVEVLGFLPLKDSSAGEVQIGRAGNLTAGNAQGREQVHPNEEQLMRIRELLLDARAMADEQDTPISSCNGTFVFSTSESQTVAAPQHAPTINMNVRQQNGIDQLASTRSSIVAEELAGDSTAADDDNVTVASTTDSLLHDAMATTLDDLTGTDEATEDEEEERIVWPRSTLREPAILNPPSIPFETSGPIMNNITPPRNRPEESPRIPIVGAERTPPVRPKPLGTTAEDLLNGVLKGGGGHVRKPSTPHSSWLFGGDGIWSFPGSISQNLPPHDASIQAQVSPLQLVPPRAQSNVGVPSVLPQISSSPIGGHHRTPSMTLRQQWVSSPSNSTRIHNNSGHLHVVDTAVTSLYSTGVPFAHEDPVFYSPNTSVRDQYAVDRRIPRMPDLAPGQNPANGLHQRLPSLSHIWAYPG